MLLASENAVKRHGLRPRGRIVDSTVVGVDPVTMLKGPIPATAKLLERTGGRRALVSMCCGGGLGTGTILERID